jgi:predicted secreted hydrolase
MHAALALLLAAGQYQVALPGYRYHFPEDHFNHPSFRTEWWYYTGNLKSREGRRYGFELVFFRQGQRRGPSQNPSVWRLDDIYLAHLAVTDIDGKSFRSEQRLNRAGPGIAGASLEQKRVWNGNWEARWDADFKIQTLNAVGDGVHLALRLRSEKPPVIHGENGVSQKAEGRGRASHYVSLTRLAVTGTLNGSTVEGLAWMDHEWFTHQLEDSQVGWDWLSVQLDDHTELMLFELRRADGSIDSYSSGTYVDRSGRAIHLERSQFQLKPLETWRSPKTGARYPVRWQIVVPSLKLTLDCAADIPNQELASENGEQVYWEGAVTYSGSAHGVGYLEMTGYYKPVRLE